MIFGHDYWNIFGRCKGAPTASAFLPLIGSDFDNTLEDDCGHAVVRADRAAVVQALGTALLDAGKGLLAGRAETQLARDDLLGEVAFADEQRHDEHARRERRRSSTALR